MCLRFTDGRLPAVPWSRQAVVAPCPARAQISHAPGLVPAHPRIPRHRPPESPPGGALRIRRPSPHLIVFALWLLVFSSASQTMILSPILPQIGEDLALDPAVLGTLVSAYSLMVGLFAVLCGP